VGEKKNAIEGMKKATPLDGEARGSTREGRWGLLESGGGEGGITRKKNNKKSLMTVGDLRWRKWGGGGGGGRSVTTLWKIDKKKES